jgi:hypothetical protein
MRTADILGIAWFMPLGAPAQLTENKGENYSTLQSVAFSLLD